MATTCEETLGRGLMRDGHRHRMALLRAPEVEERRGLLDRSADALPAERATALLGLALVAVGDVQPVTPDDVRALTIGDRARLTLALRRLLHGDALECVFACACGERLELTVDVGEVLGAGAGACARDEAAATAPDGRAVRVRAASGADHERASRRALSDPDAAARELLQACIVDVRDGAGEPAPVDDAVLELAEPLLAAVDPQAEILLAGECPACGESVTAALDPIAHLWAELEQRHALLEHEIHVLALHYHWSEHEIVALAPRRRARYIAALERELAVS